MHRQQVLKLLVMVCLRLGWRLMPGIIINGSLMCVASQHHGVHRSGAGACTLHNVATVVRWHGRCKRQVGLISCWPCTCMLLLGCHAAPLADDHQLQHLLLCLHAHGVHGIGHNACCRGEITSMLAPGARRCALAMGIALHDVADNEMD